MDEENVVFIHNGILLSHKEGNLSFAGKRMELDSIILSEVTQSQEAESHMFFLICGI
jgi:hypothetical protein